MKPRVLTGIRVALVVVSPDWQPRESLDTEHTRELVDALAAGVRLPPLDVVDMGNDGFALVDGYHRHAALQAAGARETDLRVVAVGDRDTARWWSLAANRGHGLKRTNAEKRAAVRHALEHVFAGDLSNEDIAAHCGVSLALVTDVRKETAEPSVREAAHAAAAAAVAADPKASVRDLAKRAGVSKSAIHRAQAKVSPSRDSVEGDTQAPDVATDSLPFEPPDHVSIPDDAPWLAVENAITTLVRLHRAQIDALGPSTAQSVRERLEAARHAVTASRPVACPAPHVGAVCAVCGGAGWTGAGRARAYARAEA